MMELLCTILIVIWLISFVWFVYAARHASRGVEIKYIGFIRTQGDKNE